MVPALDTLIADSNYQFRLVGLRPIDIAKATFANGTVTVNDSGISIHPNSTTSFGKRSLLQLFTKKDKILRVAHEYKFSILPSPSRPEFDIRAQILASDMIWYLGQTKLEAKQALSKSDLLRSRGTYYGTNTPIIEFRASNGVSGVGVGEFIMSITCNGETQNFTGSHNLTGDMIEAIRNVTPGCLVKFSKIHAIVSMTLDERIGGPFEITIK